MNTTPSRVVGQTQLAVTSMSPNLVEGRELYGPQGLALDTSATPPILYVADTGNNRVLAWRNATQFSNGAPADLVIGQRDRVSTLPQGPGVQGAFATGLNSPTGMAVRNGNLYVVDSGNNRVLRYPRPFEQVDVFPDLVIGQQNFNARGANYNSTQISARGVAFNIGGVAYRAGIAFDSSPNGNLWVADPGNRRVLRFPNLDRAQGIGGFEADLEIGQFDFTSTATPLDINQAASLLVKDRFAVPSALAFDPQGNLYVSDSDSGQPGRFSRILVFRPPFFNGMSASRIMGVVPPPAQPDDPPIPRATLDRTLMSSPEGIFFLPGNAGIGVLDYNSSRILIFDVLSQWPEETESTVSPLAKALVGHTDYSNREPNNRQPTPTGRTLAFPSAAVMTPNELFIADSGNHRVIVVPYAGGTFGEATRVIGQDRIEANAPNLVEGREFQFVTRTSAGAIAEAAMVVDTRSDTPRLYVADPNNNRVLGFRDLRSVRPGDKADIVIGQPDFVTSMCNYPTNDLDRPTQSSLCHPVGLALDNEGNLYVADSFNGRVLRFPDPFARQGTLPQADLVLGQSSFTIKITDPSPRTMSRPYGIAFVGDSGLIVSDADHNRVLFFPRINGTFTNGQSATKVMGQADFTSTLPGSDLNRMNGPALLSSDTDARPYVVDVANNRVLIFDSIDRIPTSGARAATSITGVNSPRGVFVSARTGEIWVTNTNGGTVLRFVRYSELGLNPRPTATIQGAAATLAVTQDQYGDLLVADAANRIAIFYPGLNALNGATFLTNRPVLAPGMVSTIKPAGFGVGQVFGNETANYADRPRPLPLPREMADIQVLVNDQPAPLYFVSPGQINFQMPMNAPTTGTVDVTVIRRSTGQILGTSAVAMDAAAPGIFHNGEGRIRRAAVLNQDGTPNSPTNPAPRGSTIQVFATGQGWLPDAPPDGEPSTGLVPTQEKPRVVIGTCFTDDCAEPDDGISYSGLAPGLVGVWQINVRIPQRTAPGPEVPLALLYKSIQSQDPNQFVTVFAVSSPQ